MLKGISMKFNPLEKRVFMLFLGLYLFSAFFFVAAVAFWYYEAQKKSLESAEFMHMRHLADLVAGKIIFTHMQGKPMPTFEKDNSYKVVLIREPGITLPLGYRIDANESILVSDSAQNHHGVKYIVVRSSQLHQKIVELKKEVIVFATLSAMMIAIIAWVLSRLFMLPLHKRIAQIERFVSDITHELNTPISALKISTKQLKRSGCNDKEKLNFIEISIKQLLDIYRSLSYLNFHHQRSQIHPVDIVKIVDETIAYYRPLANSKQIQLKLHLHSRTPIKHLNKDEIFLLFGNLISNAIKYSHRDTHIDIIIDGDRIAICDEGIGIDRKKVASIFQKFERATATGGGFGIGLNVVKRICNEYGIKIKIDTQEGSGTMVMLDFSEAMG